RVRRHYFAPGRSGRSTLPQRARPYLHLGPADIGEVLAWGSYRRSTPAAVIVAWLRSPTHRPILLDPRYRQLGGGVTGDGPTRHYRVAATYAVEFGRPRTQSRKSHNTRRRDA